MSYIHYIASARPLPVGTWSSSPLREYPSYEAYGKRPDFQTVWENSVASGEAFQNEFPPEHRLRKSWSATAITGAGLRFTIIFPSGRASGLRILRNGNFPKAGS